MTGTQCTVTGRKESYMGSFRPTPKENGIKGAMGAVREAVIAAALIQADILYGHRMDTCTDTISLLRMLMASSGKYNAKQHG
jgi:hypothetical protein